jgi:hypothetical protein
MMSAPGMQAKMNPIAAAISAISPTTFGCFFVFLGRGEPVCVGGP